MENNFHTTRFFTLQKDFHLSLFKQEISTCISVCLQIINYLAGTWKAGVCVSLPAEGQGTEEKAFLQFIDTGR